MTNERNCLEPVITEPEENGMCLSDALEIAWELTAALFSVIHLIFETPGKRGCYILAQFAACYWFFI